MQCPECNIDLKRGTEKNSNTEIDYCRSCKGIWLDEGEIERVCKFAVSNMSIPASAQSSVRDCPKCKVPMRQFDYPSTMVTVDMCPTCKGIWLDSGEIKEISLVRENRKDPLYSEAIREKTAQTQKKLRSKKWYTDNKYRYINKKRYKIIDFLIAFIILSSVIGVSVYFFIDDTFGWKKDAARAKNSLKEHYTSMPSYEDNRQYIDHLIETTHQQVYNKCKNREWVTKIFRKNQYEYVFDERKYLDLMKQKIIQQARNDKKPEIVSWTSIAKI